MVDFLEIILEERGVTMTHDERNLLAVAFKNLVSSKRSACRTISSVEQNPKYEKYAACLTQYRQKIESQLQTDCHRIINMIEIHALSK